MTEPTGWEPPSGTPGEAPAPQRPPLRADWATEQPAPQGWGQPGYGQQPGQPGQPGQPSQPGWGPPGQQVYWQPPKPGVIPLRPLGVGEILDGAISTIRAKPRLMIGLSAVLAVFTQFVMVPITWALLHDAGDRAVSIGQKANGAENDVALTASSFTASAIQAIITLGATLLLTGILTIVLSRAVLGQDIDGKQAWAEARPRLPALLGVTVMVFLIEIAVAVVFVVPGFVLIAVGSTDVAVGLAFLIGIPAYALVAIYLYVAFALAPAIAVLERQPVFASLARSRRLVKGAWWRTFGILLLVNIIAGIASGIFGGIFLFAAFIASGASSFSSFNAYDLVPLIVSGIGAIVGAAITWPFTAVASALLYVDRRIRREGLDIELARAAGVPPPGQSATPGTPLPYGG